MDIIENTKEENFISINGLKLHEVYQNLNDNEFYTIVKISSINSGYYTYILNLKTMQIYEPLELITMNKFKFKHVDYQFEIRN